MDRSNLNDLLRWLSGQIDTANEIISESHRTNNFGREAMYEGMKNAYLNCINKLKKREEEESGLAS